MSSSDMTKRIRKAAISAILGLLIVVAGLIIYYTIPQPIVQSRVLLLICLVAGGLALVLSLYFFMVGDTGKERKNVRFSDFSLWFRTIAVIVIFGALFVYDQIDKSVIIGIFIFLSIYSWTIVHYMGHEPARDERRVRISTTAAMYSWYASLFIMSGILTIDYFLGLHLSIVRYFAAMVLVMVITMQGSNVYLSRKGDVA